MRRAKCWLQAARSKSPQPLEGREEGIQRGIEKGRAEGIEKGRIEVAKNMLANGLDIE